MTTAFIVLCCAVFWATFCRLVHTNARTRISIRSAFWFAASVSSYVLGLTLLGKFHPSLEDVMVVGAFAAVLVATGRRWLQGVPVDYEHRSTATR